jgi:hypothetical protein
MQAQFGLQSIGEDLAPVGTRRRPSAGREYK